MARMMNRVPDLMEVITEQHKRFYLGDNRLMREMEGYDYEHDEDYAGYGNAAKRARQNCNCSIATESY